MPRPSKGARLVWRDESFKRDGSLRNSAGWFIRDGGTFISACGGTGDRAKAEIRLAAHITEKYQPARERGRDPAEIKIADAVNVYLTDVVPKHAKPKEAAARLVSILKFFGETTLGDINGKLCRDYLNPEINTAAPPEAAGRRQLEDLRAAVNHYHREGYVTAAPAIVLPAKPEARERWLTREEAARLLRAAWRMRQTWKGRRSDRRTGQHVARFILVALYTGSRSGAVCGAATRLTEGHGFVDYERGVFYRRPQGKAETKKRQPPVRLPDRLLAHMRRWATTEHKIKTEARCKSVNVGRMISHDFVVEWQGEPIKDISKAFRAAVEAAGLGWYDEEGVFQTDVTPHILRHTAATWLMQAGGDPWQAAGFFGMTVEVLINTYGHHHPDFQADAADAITRKALARRAPKNVVSITAARKQNIGTPPHENPTENPETNANIRDAL